MFGKLEKTTGFRPLSERLSEMQIQKLTETDEFKAWAGIIAAIEKDTKDPKDEVKHYKALIAKMEEMGVPTNFSQEELRKVVAETI